MFLVMALFLVQFSVSIVIGMGRRIFHRHTWECQLLGLFIAQSPWIKGQLGVLKYLIERRCSAVMVIIYKNKLLLHVHIRNKDSILTIPRPHFNAE